MRHLLTTAIRYGRIDAETIDHFLAGSPEDKHPKVDVHQFNLLAELHARHLDPAPYDHTQTRGTSGGMFTVHNYEDRGAARIIPHSDLFKGQFGYVARSKRHERHIEADQVLGGGAKLLVPFIDLAA